MVFCFPNAGGGGTQYLSWRRALPSSLWLQPIQLPGRDNRIVEPPEFDPGEIAEALMHRVDRPYALYGHSMGGVLACEVVRELIRRGGRLPDVVYLGACLPPHVDHGWVRHWAGLDDDELLDEVAGLGGIPSAVLEQASVRRRVAAVMRSDVVWLDSIPPDRLGRLPVAIVAFAGADDPLVGPAAMAHWDRYTSEDFTLRSIRGGHLFHMENAHALTSAIANDVTSTGGNLHGIR
ncbi:thioesterase II family protein [Nocardiopsis mwathae]|uniref:thioesterase II family protein n=1 Tax=Nocardiopsis mwathae TaxID=1472723 RepID=UPI0031B5F39F